MFRGSEEKRQKLFDSKVGHRKCFPNGFEATLWSRNERSGR